MRIFYRIEAKYFTVKIEAEYPVTEHIDQVCTFAPPIVKFMKGWKWNRVEKYCEQKGWKLKNEGA